MAESIKLYPLQVSSINLSNNGLKSRDCTVLIESMERHFAKLSVLNLSKNRLGTEGSEFLSNHLRSMKELTTLDLSNNEIGDYGVA